jgi:hypothetical protein
MVVEASCSEDVFQRQGLGDESGSRERWTEQSTSLMKTCSRALRTSEAKVHLPTGQQLEAQSQDNAGVSSWQVSVCPDLPFLERPENSCSATLPIQPDRTWGDLQKRMGETPQILVCHACSVIPKKTRGFNRCQRYFNKVLSKGSEYLRKYFNF